MAHCVCGDVWRIEACDLRTGTVRAILHPISMDWESTLNRAGQGTMTLATREVNVRDIWPHLTSIYITRIGGTPDATPDTPIAEYAAMVEKFEAGDNGTTQLGFHSIEHYLNKREIRRRLRYDQVSQNEIARQLVLEAAPDGIPLTATADVTARIRDRGWEAWELKNIGEAIEQLTDVIEGPDWELVHTKTNGRWATDMIFRDEVGTDRNVILQSDREASGYGLDVDAEDHATSIVAVGEGEEEAMLLATSDDASGIYPRFDASPAWKDVSVPNTLQEHADGYLEENKEPVATPSAEISGLDPDPAMLKLGDTITENVNFGAVTFSGKARITAIAWKVGVGEPPTRSLALTPITRASQSVLNQQPTEGCVDC